MKNKKLYYMLLCTVMIFVILTGCAGSSVTDQTDAGSKVNSPNTSENAEPVTINYYGFVDDKGMESKFITAFEEQNPGIKVRLVELPDASDDKLKTINTVLQAGDSSIDVFVADVAWAPVFAGAKWVLPWDELVSREQLKDYMPGGLDAFTYKGVTYGLPFYVDGGVLFYRSDLLDKYNKRVPTTWEDLIVTSKEIMDAEKDPALRGFGSIWKQFEGLTCSALEIIWANGGDIVNENSEPDIKTAEIESSLQMMYDMIYTDKIACEGITTFGNTELRNEMFSGNVIFTRDWSSAYSQYNDPEKSKVAGKVELAALPAGTSGSSASALGGWGAMISAYSKNVDAAVKFAMFRASSEVQKDVIMNFKLNNPSYIPLYDDPECLTKYPVIKDLKAAMYATKPRPRTPYYAELSAILQLEIHSVLSDVKTPAEAAANIKTKIEQLLK